MKIHLAPRKHASIVPHPALSLKGEEIDLAPPAFVAFSVLLVLVSSFVHADAAQAQTINCCLRTTVQTYADPSIECHKQGDPKCTGSEPKQCPQIGLLGEELCTEIKEEIIACETHEKCRGVLESTLADCPNKPVVAQPNLPNVQCDKTPSCTVFNNQCYSVYDKNVCSDIRDPGICGNFQACRWENNKCVTLLQSAISSQYDLTEQGRGKFLEPCAIDGSCRNTNDILKLLLNITDYAMKLIGVLAFVMFIAGGVIMITSFGKEEQFKKGQQMLVYAIIGIIVSVSAVLIVKFVLDAIGVEKAFRVF